MIGPRIEKHAWGYFLEDGKKAVAVVGHRWADVVKALRDEFGKHPRRSGN